MNVKGQSVAIIGGSSGIGLAVARLAAESGASVAIMGRSTDRLDGARRQLPSSVMSFVGDACRPDDVARFIDSLASVDHVLTTAGTFVPDPKMEKPLDELQAVMTARFSACVNAVRAARSRLSQGGSFVFMSGTATYRPEGAPLSSAACGAVEALARSLAVDLAPVRVNCIAPGYVRTPLWDAFGEGAGQIIKTLEEKLPLKRFGRADEVAHAVLFLMANTYMTGTTLTIDGGLRLI